MTAMTAAGLRTEWLLAKLNDKLKLSHKARAKITFKLQTICYDFVLHLIWTLQEEPKIPSKSVNESNCSQFFSPLHAESCVFRETHTRRCTYCSFASCDVSYLTPVAHTCTLRHSQVTAAGMSQIVAVLSMYLQIVFLTSKTHLFTALRFSDNLKISNGLFSLTIKRIFTQSLNLKSLKLEIHCFHRTGTDVVKLLLFWTFSMCQLWERMLQYQCAGLHRKPPVHCRCIDACCTPLPFFSYLVHPELI